MTLEGRPFEPFPWRINGLRAFSGQANRLLTLHNLYIKPSCYNRVSKKAANRPKVPRRMIGRRRGCPPFSIPPRRESGLPSPQGRCPSAYGLHPKNGAPTALRLTIARRKRLAEVRALPKGAKAPSGLPNCQGRGDSCAVAKSEDGSSSKAARLNAKGGVGLPGPGRDCAPQVSRSGGIQSSASSCRIVS